MLNVWRHYWDKHVMHRFAVPESLDVITDRDWQHEVDPLKAGLSLAAVDNIWAAVTDFYRAGMHPMLSLCLRRHGHIVLNRSIGYLRGIEDGAEPVVANVNTPVCLFSASKVVTAILAHKLAEEGYINLLDPVSYYLPEFAAHGKGDITVYQVLAHRAGIPKIEGDLPPETAFDHDQAIQHICQERPIDTEGRTTAYHAITGGYIIAELVKLTTGMDIQAYLDKVIRKPMGMKYFRYGLLPEQLDLVPEHYQTGLPLGPAVGSMLKKVLGVSVEDAVRLSNDAGFKTSVVPSANLYATAEEAGRFFQMLLDHGEWQGKSILSPLSVHRATREVGGITIDKSLFMPMRYSAGMMLGGDPVGIYGRHTHYAFGHIGFANVFCWADPQRDTSVALMTSGKPVLGAHIPGLLRLINMLSSECPPCVDMISDEPHYKRRRGKLA